MKIRIRQIAVLSLLALLLGVGISSFHYHADGRIKSECPVCRYQYSGISAVTDTCNAAVESVPAADETVPGFRTSPVRIPCVCPNTFPNAPPLFS